MSPRAAFRQKKKKSLARRRKGPTEATTTREESGGGGRGREDTVPMSAALGFPLATPVHDASWGRPSTRTHIYTVHTEFGHARTTPWA
jgi:hypothetical protein